jgi:hypothetical protein
MDLTPVLRDKSSWHVSYKHLTLRRELGMSSYTESIPSRTTTSCSSWLTKISSQSVACLFVFLTYHPQSKTCDKVHFINFFPLWIMALSLYVKTLSNPRWWCTWVTWEVRWKLHSGGQLSWHQTSSPRLSPTQWHRWVFYLALFCLVISVSVLCQLYTASTTAVQ